MGDKATKAIFKGPTYKQQLCDVIKHEYSPYQNVDIPESYYSCNDEVRTNRNKQSSYWEYAYNLVDLQADDTEDSIKFKRVDTYWKGMGTIIDVW